MKLLACLLLASSAAFACPAPPEYPKQKPFLECPTKLTKQKVITACEKPGACAYGIRLEWHYAIKPASLLAEWEQLLTKVGYKVERVAVAQSEPSQTVWLRATKGKEQWDTWIDPDGNGSRLAFME